MRLRLRPTVLGAHAQSHICILQTTMDLIERGYDVYVVADGVSSSRPEEVPIALARMRQAGAQITTSESAAFELQGAFLSVIPALDIAVAD